MNSKIVFLTNSFYKDHPNPPFKEMEQKQNRPYIVFLVEIEGHTWAIPFRSHIRHGHAFFTDPENKKYGFDGWWFEINLLLTTGKPVIDMKDGVITSNLMSAEMERAENFMLDMNKMQLPLPKAEYNWVEQPQRIAEGTTLFYPCGVWALYEADLSKCIRRSFS